jgi:hypothetical protein
VAFPEALQVYGNFCESHIFARKNMLSCGGQTADTHQLLHHQYICAKLSHMIQRIQTLFLLVSTVALVVSYFIPFGSFSEGIQLLELRSYGIKSQEGIYLDTVSTWWFHIPLSMVIVANLWTLFLFNDRRRQILILKLTFLLFAISFVLLSMYIHDAGKAYADTKMKPGISVVLLFVGLALNWLSARAIRKDEELIRSVDRIR